MPHDKKARKPHVTNLELPLDQAEWLRTQAYKTRRSQAAIVRQALDEHRQRAEPGARRLPT